MHLLLDPKRDVVFKLLFTRNHPDSRQALLGLLTAMLRPSPPRRETATPYLQLQSGSLPSGLGSQETTRPRASSAMWQQSSSAERSI